MGWLWEVCCLACLTDTGFVTNSISSPSHSEPYWHRKIHPEVRGTMFPPSFSNQIGLAGHSSTALPLGMLFYFNGTSFVRLTRKASVSCSKPAGQESSPNWEHAGTFRGAQNLSWQPCTRGGFTAPIMWKRAPVSAWAWPKKHLWQQWDPEVKTIRHYNDGGHIFLPPSVSSSGTRPWARHPLWFRRQQKQWELTTKKECD